MAKNSNQSWYSMKARADGEVDISIYDEIGFFGVTAADFKNTLDSYSGIELINLSIHSPGGSVFEGLAIYNLLKSHYAAVSVHVDGLAASIASVIAMAGDEVVIPENAYMMIHKPTVYSGGDAEKLRKDADLLDKVEGTLVGIYADKTKLDRDELAEMLEAETWLTGDEAVSLGFADKLAEPIKVAANFNINSPKGRYLTMPENVKEMIGGKGETSTVDDKTVETITEDQILAKEVARRTEIKAVFDGFEEHAAIRDAYLDDPKSDVESARRDLLAAIGKSKTPSAAAIHVDNGRIVRDHLSNALAARAGLGELENGNGFAGMTLIEMARASLVENGAGVAGLDRMQVIANAFTHSSGDFGNVLIDAANKAMLRGYEEVQETFEAWTHAGNLPDFKVNSRVDLSNFPSLRKVNEGAEYNYVTTTDRRETIVLATYGELFSITRQAIINDDLSVFTRVPQLMGRAARRTVGDLVYGVLTSNVTMSDGKALFHTDHDNIVTGTFGTDKIDEAKVAMMLQSEGNGTLNIRPRFMLSPVTRESTAKSYLSAEYDADSDSPNAPNPIRNMVEVIADARLDEASATTTYLVADPGTYDTIEVAYLDGNANPYLEQQDGFTVDGATMKVRMDAGVAPLSFRTFVRLSDT